MEASITAERADEIGDGSRVCHYDELDQATKERFPQLAGAAGVSVNQQVADGLREFDVVKYTDYYAVTLH